MKYLRIFGLTVAMVALCAAVAFAAEGGGGASKLWNLLWRTISFVIVVGILWKLAAGPLKEFFAGRTYQIKSELDDLETRKADAEKRLKEVEQSIADLEQKRQEILETFRGEGEKLKTAIIAQAEESAKKIKAQAEVSAAQEAQEAMKAIKAEMADEIVQTAEKLIKEKLSKEDHEKLVDEYLTKVVLH
ncbi:MAG: F0F1 ATP synthase subunit B [Desulfovibrionales bacterium]